MNVCMRIQINALGCSCCCQRLKSGKRLYLRFVAEVRYTASFFTPCGQIRCVFTCHIYNKIGQKNDVDSKTVNLQKIRHFSSCRHKAHLSGNLQDVTLSLSLSLTLAIYCGEAQWKRATQTETPIWATLHLLRGHTDCLACAFAQWWVKIPHGRPLRSTALFEKEPGHIFWGNNYYLESMTTRSAAFKKNCFTFDIL